MIDICDLKNRLKDENFLHQTLLPGFIIFVGLLLALRCLCAACINLFEMLIAALIAWADDILNPVEEEAHDNDHTEEA